MAEEPRIASGLEADLEGISAFESEGFGEEIGKEIRTTAAAKTVI